MSCSPDTARKLMTVGVSPFPRIQPLREGIYNLGGVLTDNSVVTTNLRAVAAAFNTEWANIMGGAAAPDVIVVIDRIEEVVLHGATESIDVMDLAIRNLQMRVNSIARNEDWFVSLTRAVSVGSDSVAAATTVAATTLAPGGRRGKAIELLRPLVIDMAQDTWDIGMFAPVNYAGANLPFGLTVHAVLIPKSQLPGGFPFQDANSDQAAANAFRARKAGIPW